jgi:ATP-dependent helicase HrpB
VRLYTRADFDARPERDPPEIARADLADTVLALRSMGMDPAGLEWLDAPPQAAVAAADALLHRLGALDAAGTVTALGRRMLALPLHPRQARIVVEAADRGRLADGCLLAALLEERDVRRGARSIDVGGGGTPRGEEDALASEGFLDPIEAVEAIAEADASREGDDGLRRRGLEPSAVAAVRRSRDQVCRLAARTRPEAAGVASPVERRTDLAKALLAGYPDRVGRVRRAGRGRGERSEFEAAAGGAADLPAGALLPEGGLLVVADAAERPGSRGTSLLVRAAVPIEEDWLFDLFLESIRESREVRFNASTGRVEAVRRLAFEGLVLDERPWDGADPAAIEGVLAEAARSAGLAGLAAKGEDVEGLLARVAFLRERCPELAIPELDGPAAERVVTELCRGKRSLAQVREAGVTRAVLASLTREQRRALQELAPESVRLPGGRALRIDYGPGRPPSVASRIQDFFGLAAGPAVLGGRLPLVVHLRSPGGKDVQVTTDLAGFWSNHYPSIARELRRRYPRHAWPDAPANAPAATGRGRPRQ